MADHWNNGLFGQVCGGDCGTCLSAWFCSCFLYGRTDQRLRKFPDTNKENFNLFNGGCCLFCAASCFSMHWLVALLKRGELRDRFGIEGGCCKDCMLSLCCTPCVLAQMETEVKDRAVRGGSGGLRDVKQGEYTSPAPPGGMQYGQQPPPPQQHQHQQHQPYQQHQQPHYQAEQHQQQHYYQAQPPQQPYYQSEPHPKPPQQY